MERTVVDQLDDLIAEFAGELRALVRAAINRHRQGTPLEEIPDDADISGLLWRLGLTGARLDELMTATTGLHAPVLASYEAAHSDADGREPSRDTDEGPGATESYVASLEFVLEGLGGLSTDSIATKIDESGERVVQELVAMGCDVSEWGSSIEEHRAPGDDQGA